MQLETNQLYQSSQILQDTGKGTDATFRALALSMVNKLQQSTISQTLIKHYAKTSAGKLNSKTLATLSKLDLGDLENHQKICTAIVPKLKEAYAKDWLKTTQAEGKDNESFKLLERAYAAWEANPESDLNLGPLSAIRQDILKQFLAVKKKVLDAESAYHQNNRFLPADKKQKIKQRMLLSAWKNGWIFNGLSGKLAKANTKNGHNPGRREDLQRWAQNTLGTQNPAAFEPSESGEIHARIVVRNSSDAAALISEEALVAQLRARNEFGQPNGNPFFAFRPFATPAQMTRLIDRIVEARNREYPDTQTGAPSRVIERRNVDQLLHQIDARSAEQSEPVQLSSQGLGTVSRQTNITPILRRLRVQRFNKGQFRIFKTEPDVARDMITIEISPPSATTTPGTGAESGAALSTHMPRVFQTSPVSSDSFSAEAGSLPSVSMYSEESSTSILDPDAAMKRFMEKRQKARGRGKSSSSGKMQPTAQIIPIQNKYRYSEASSVPMQGLDINLPTPSTVESYSMRSTSEAPRASVISQLTSPASITPAVDSKPIDEAVAAHRKLMESKKAEIARVKFAEPAGGVSGGSKYLQRLRVRRANEGKTERNGVRPRAGKLVSKDELARHKSSGSPRR